MKYGKILMCLTVLVCLAFQAFAQDPLGAGSSGSSMGSGGDYLSPNMGQKYPTDWLEGGYVRSSDRSIVDPGIAGMLHWLDTPVPNFPWYTASDAFYTKSYSYTTFSPYTEYYVPSGSPVVGGIISNPTKFDITKKTPSRVYYGAGVGLPYPQYEATVTSKTNDLWIQGETNWTQYVVSPVGTWLQLIAYAPIAGSAGFYETIQTDTTSTKYKTYLFNQGYNTMNFYADQVGRHMLNFVVNSQPSNTVIVDVFALAPSTQYQTYASTTTTPTVSTLPQTPTVNGDTPVTIQSQGMRGYQVFLDGNYIGTEGTGGDPLDGRFSFNVVGNQNHDIRVYDGQFNYPKTMFFQKGVQKIINVEPGTAVYI